MKILTMATAERIRLDTLTQDSMRGMTTSNDQQHTQPLRPAGELTGEPLSVPRLATHPTTPAHQDQTILIHTLVS